MSLVPSFSETITRFVRNDRRLPTTALAVAWWWLWTLAETGRADGWAGLAVGVMAWAGSSMARWEESRDPSGHRWMERGLLLAALGLAIWAALARLPSGLVAAAAPVGVMVLAQGLLSLGPERPWGARSVVLMAAGLGLLLLAAGLPWAGPRWVGLLLMALFFTSAVGVWRSPHLLQRPRVVLATLRGLAFAGGVMLPVSWVEAGHWQNGTGGLTALYGILMMGTLSRLRRRAAAPEATRPGFDPLALLALALALAAMAGLRQATGGTILIHQAVAASSLALGGALCWPGSRKGSLTAIWLAIAAAGVVALLGWSSAAGR